MPPTYQTGDKTQLPEPKPKPVPPMRASWLRLKANGYDVIPLRSGKDTPYSGWPGNPNQPADILKWQGRAAGVRLFDDSVDGAALFVIDLDTRSIAVRDAIVDALWRRWPDFIRDALRRGSGSTTLALIGRCNTLRKGGHTARFEAGADEKPHLVEYFTRRDRRQLAVCGAHSPGRQYSYFGRDILDTPVAALPWFPDAEIGAMVDCCEITMKTIGLAPVGPPPRRDGDVTKIYDLEPTAMFRLSDGEVLTLAELALRAPAGDRLKGSAAIWDPASKTPDRVLVTWSRADGLCLWDTKEGLSHRMAARTPVPSRLQQILKDVAKQLKTTEENQQ